MRLRAILAVIVGILLLSGLLLVLTKGGSITGAAVFGGDILSSPSQHDNSVPSFANASQNRSFAEEPPADTTPSHPSLPPNPTTNGTPHRANAHTAPQSGQAPPSSGPLGIPPLPPRVPGFVIHDLQAGRSAVLEENMTLDVTFIPQRGIKHVILLKDDEAIGRMAINFSSDRSFRNIISDVDRKNRKAVLHIGDPTPSLADRTLLIPRETDSGKVYICPHAATLEEVVLSCPDMEIILVGETKRGMGVSRLTLNNKTYYAITNVSGTGGAEALPPGKDTYIVSAKPDKNFGASPVLWLDRISFNLSRVLFEFNLSNISSNSRITGAQLRLYIIKASNPTADLNVSTHALTQSWVEGTCNGPGPGCPDGTTWNTYDGTGPWVAAGGDFSAAAEDSVNISATGFYYWNLSDLVQNWVNGSAANNGIILVTPEDVQTNAKSIAGHAHAHSNIRPRLLVNFTTPLNITFVDPTPANGSVLAADSVFINVSITNGNATITLLEWNGTNETMTNALALPSDSWFQNKTGLLNGNYAYRVHANDSDTGLFSVSETRTVEIRIPDTDPPEVFDLRPIAGSIFSSNEAIEIAANVTDDTGVDAVLANITYPNGSIEQIMLAQAIADKYNASFSSPPLEGRYNVTFIANDTAGNRNDSETTFFFVEQQAAIDREISIAGANVTKVSSGRLNETTAGSSEAKGGQATNINLAAISSTQKWQGYVGEVSASLELGVASDTIYSFGEAADSQIRTVFASPTVDFDFSSLFAASASDVDTAWGFNAGDADSATNTFDDGDATIARVTNVPVAHLVAHTSAGVQNSSIYQSGIFRDGSPVLPGAFGAFAFGVPIVADQKAFDNVTQVDYELLVPVNASAGMQTYYFFLDIG